MVLARRSLTRPDEIAHYFPYAPLACTIADLSSGPHSFFAAWKHSSIAYSIPATFAMVLRWQWQWQWQWQWRAVAPLS
ncbi:hypothetical protein ACIOMM_36005 [Streptomyces sp. NPDC087908]|uniref:hypothetical protein n=1 Tax=Streptomyces sp. NPDC087908 TaxID=3365820 RepID=UPI003803EBCC